MEPPRRSAIHAHAPAPGQRLRGAVALPRRRAPAGGSHAVQLRTALALCGQSGTTQLRGTTGSTVLVYA